MKNHFNNNKSLYKINSNNMSSNNKKVLIYKTVLQVI